MTIYIGYKLTQYLFTGLVLATIGLYIYCKFKPKKQAM